MGKVSLVTSEVVPVTAIKYSTNCRSQTLKFSA